MSDKKDSPDDIPHDGVQAVADLFDVMDPKDQKRIMEELKERDPNLLAQIQDRMFNFLDLVKLDPKSFQKLFTEIPQKKWALAFRGIEDDPKAKLFAHLSKRARSNLEEEIDDLGPQRLTDVTEARKEIVDKAKALAEAGEIQIQSGSEEMV